MTFARSSCASLLFIFILLKCTNLICLVAFAFACLPAACQDLPLGIVTCQQQQGGPHREIEKEREIEAEVELV